MALIKEDVKTYRRILNPFSKDSDKDEWLINIDTIRLFFKNIITSDNEDSDEFQEEAVNIAANVVTKCEELLNISEEFINLKFVKNNLAKLIEKKCRELACGKVTAKAKYQYIAIDPISYMNFAMHRDQGENGLNAGEFYCADCNDGEIRTISRNPLCAYSEIHNVKFVRNAFLDNYFSPCRELLYFNSKSDILALLSSADQDGDSCTVIDLDIIKNAVVTPQDGKYFINKDDGHKKLMVYNAANRFLATYRASGNLIGKIALKSASINSNSQQTYDYYDIANAKFILNMGFDEEDKKLAKEKLESGEWITTYNASEQHREHIKQRFFENEKDIYVVLYNAMVSIDAPKTLYFPSPEDMEIINKKYGRKARFLQYKENKADVVDSQYEYTFGLLDSISRLIKDNLLKEINRTITKFDNKAELIQGKLINGDYSVSDYPTCLEEIEKLYKGYTEERKAVNKESYSEIRKETKKRDWAIENSSWSQWEESEYDASVAALKSVKYKQYKEIDAKYIVVADEILKKYDIVTISNSIGNLKNCTEDFIINLFFPVFSYLNFKLQAHRYVYKKAGDGDITYLYERYMKIQVEAIDNSNIVKNLHLEEKNRLKVINIKVDVRARILDDEVVELIESELEDKGQVVFNIKVLDNKVILVKDEKDMLEVFNEFIQIKEYSLLNCNNIKFEILVNVAPSRKSLKLTSTEIN